MSPVGNRITVFDLIKYVRNIWPVGIKKKLVIPPIIKANTASNKSYGLPFSHRKNISRLTLNSRGNLLLSTDEDGQTIVANFPRQIALHHFSFKGPVSALSFSPSGRHFAVGLGRLIEVWVCPLSPDVVWGFLLRKLRFAVH